MEKNRKKRLSLAASIIGAIVIILIVFGVIVSSIGVMSFTDSFEREYTDTTYNIANTATSLVIGDHLDEYLAGEEQEEYETSKEYLESYCRKIGVTMIYVIKVDTSDYGRFVSVFNPLNDNEDAAYYTEWELGYERNTTNDEYRSKYRAIYEEGSLFETVYRSHPTDGQKPHITSMVPIKDAKGDVVAILCVQRPISELDNIRRPYLIKVGSLTAILACVAAALAAFYMRKYYVTPIRKISSEATRFAKENTKGEALGDVSRLEEISSLASSIDTMETDMVNYIDNLTAATAEKEKISAELNIARTIQESAIPSDFPAFPDRKDFDIYASMDPAKEVGGDFYNFFLYDEEHLFFMIGDVSGKGIPASLFMMSCNILITDIARMGGKPSEILTFLNENVSKHNEADMFITVWIGILNLRDGMLVYANAGHEDAAIYHKDGSFELLKTKHDLVVGAVDEFVYTDHRIEMNKGDKIFIYTDGVPEATDKDNDMYGLERMIEALNIYRNGSPQEILEGVASNINDFVGEAPQFDDLTMLCLELKDDYQ